MDFNWNSNSNTNANTNTNTTTFSDFINNVNNKFSKNLRKKQKKFTIIFSIIFALIFYYIFLPPLNIRARESWIFILSILAIYVLIGGKSFKNYRILRRVFFGLILLFLLLQVPGLKLFTSRSYSKIIDVKESNFSEDIEELSIDQIPTLDRDSSTKVGARKMGELLDLVSQFDIDETTYTQINYKDKPVRVTPLKYDGFIKYLFNMREGIPGYLEIDIVNGDSKLIKLDEKIKISKKDYFFRNIYRYTRLRYPFEIFDEINFEIDENGIPYWVIPTYSPKVFLFDGLDVNGAILVNASTGEHKKYNLDEIPTWLDRIYNASNIIEQLDWNGQYKDGYINSIFAQKNVLLTTEGYNYLALNDDVYLYTGYTSAAADESNVGFILSNLRTKETKFYPVSSAKELSAMESAEGAVQEKNYNATFPLLLNVKGQPTYFLSLKDNAGLIKTYAFIDAKNYQRVSIGSTVNQALQQHLSTMTGSTDIEENKENVEIFDNKGVIETIQSVVINGNTHYYFTLQGKDEIYVTNISLSDKLPFINKGSSIEFKYEKTVTNNVVEITNIELN